MTNEESICRALGIAKKDESATATERALHFQNIYNQAGGFNHNQWRALPWSVRVWLNQAFANQDPSLLIKQADAQVQNVNA